MQIVYLTVSQVEAYHAQALKEHGGLHGLRSRELLESAVLQPQQSAFTEDAYPTLAEKAAAYGYFLAENQPFIDGNKRTGAAAMEAFLNLNGLLLDQTEDQIYEAFMKIATKKWSRDDFFKWVVSATRED